METIKQLWYRLN